MTKDERFFCSASQNFERIIDLFQEILARQSGKMAVIRAF